MPLSHGPKGALLCPVPHREILFLDQIIPKQGSDILFRRMGKQAGNVFVQRVLVLVEPAVRLVFDFSGVMVEDETFLEPGGFVFVGLALPEGGQFCQEGFVGSLGDHTFFVQARQDSNWLKKKKISITNQSKKKMSGQIRTQKNK
jgi:hypothetical protein